MHRLGRALVVLAAAGAPAAIAAAAVAAVAAKVGKPAPGAASAAASPAGAERRLVLFYTAEVHGAVEPCGCTSNPLGDISRLAALVAAERRPGTGVALVDAGSLLYPEGAIAARERPSAELRAKFLAAEMERIGLTGAGLGETDIAPGNAVAVTPARLAANVSGAPAGTIRAARVETIGGIRVGVLGVADPAVVAALGGGKADDMFAAARREVERLRSERAEIVVLLAPVEKTAGRKLARESGADVVVLGRRVGGGMPRLEQAGRAFIAAPADEMQKVGRLEIVLRAAPSTSTSTSAPASGGAIVLVDAGGPEAARLRREELNRALERLRVALVKWIGPQGELREGADPAYVASKKKEEAELKAEAAAIDRPWQPPATGSYVVNQLVPLRRSLPRAPAVVAAMKGLDRRIAAENLAHKEPPPPPEAGRASFVGMAKCAGHDGAHGDYRQEAE